MANKIFHLRKLWHNVWKLLGEKINKSKSELGKAFARKVHYQSEYELWNDSMLKAYVKQNEKLNSLLENRYII